MAATAITSCFVSVPAAYAGPSLLAHQGAGSPATLESEGRFASSVSELLRPTRRGPEPFEVSAERSPEVRSQRIRPVISVPRIDALPYSGIVALRLTVDGAPLNGSVHLGVGVTTPTDSWVDTGIIDVDYGAAFYEHHLGASLIGQQVRMVFFIVEDDAYLASSASPRTWDVVDLPRPVLSFSPEPYVTATGVLAVDVSATNFPFVDELDINMVTDLGVPRTRRTMTSTATAGRALFAYDYTEYLYGHQMAVDVWAPATEFTKASSLPTRDTMISKGSRLGYHMPTGTTMKRKGAFVVFLGVGSDELWAMNNNRPETPFFLDIAVDGRSYRFRGTFGYRSRGCAACDVAEPSVQFDYELPETAVARTVRVVTSHPTDALFAASSSSPRSYTIVK